jgi:hypothetical protein
MGDSSTGLFVDSIYCIYIKAGLAYSFFRLLWEQQTTTTIGWTVQWQWVPPESEISFSLF